VLVTPLLEGRRGGEDGAFAVASGGQLQVERPREVLALLVVQPTSRLMPVAVAVAISCAPSHDDVEQAAEQDAVARWDREERVAAPRPDVDVGAGSVQCHVVGERRDDGQRILVVHQREQEILAGFVVGCPDADADGDQFAADLLAERRESLGSVDGSPGYMSMHGGDGFSTIRGSTWCPRR
jgi:hypothetical protein